MPKSKKTEVAKPQVSIQTATPKGQDIEVKQEYVGYITPINSVDIIPYIAGFVEKILVNGGDEVQVNQELILIRPEEYQASYDLAQAQLLSAQTTYTNAKTYFERIKKAGDKAVSKSNYDDAKTAYENSDAGVKQAKANLALAKNNLSYTKILATINGAVGNINLSVGDYISPQSHGLFKIVQYNPIRVVFSLSDKDFLSTPDFSQQKIALNLINGKTLEGKFEYADNEVNSGTNTIAIYAKFDNPNKELIAGAYADVLVYHTYHDAILIPQNLVIMNTEGNFIKILKGSEKSLKSIEILTSKDSNYVIKNTFAADEKIILGQKK